MLRKRRSDYIYDGFRDPIQKITGDAYRAICGIQETTDSDERMPWNRDDDFLLLTMGPLDTFRDIADMCGCSDCSVKRAYQRLLKAGLVVKRADPRAFTPNETVIMHQLPQLGLTEVTRQLPRRTNGVVRDKAKRMGYHYDTERKVWYFRGKEAA